MGDSRYDNRRAQQHYPRNDVGRDAEMYGRGGPVGRGEDRGRDGGRKRSRSRSRDRDGGRDRDRGRERDMDRGYQRDDRGPPANPRDDRGPPPNRREERGSGGGRSHYDAPPPPDMNRYAKTLSSSSTTHITNTSFFHIHVTYIFVFLLHF